MVERPLTNLEQHMARYNWKKLAEVGEGARELVKALVEARMLDGRRGLSQVVITKEREKNECKIFAS